MDGQRFFVGGSHCCSCRGDFTLDQLGFAKAPPRIPGPAEIPMVNLKRAIKPPKQVELSAFVRAVCAAGDWVESPVKGPTR